MKKAILTLLMIPAFVGMLFSCSEVKTDAKKLEGKWNIVEVKGEKILKEGLPNMEFDMKDNKVHGNAGCNIFNSTVVLDDQDISSITINPAATTMMACPDMEVESAFFKMLENPDSYGLPTPPFLLMNRNQVLAEFKSEPLKEK